MKQASKQGPLKPCLEAVIWDEGGIQGVSIKENRAFVSLLRGMAKAVDTDMKGNQALTTGPFDRPFLDSVAQKGESH